MTQPAQFYKAVTFYFGVPLAIGITFGFARAGTMAPLFPKPVSIIYWCSLLVVLWLCYEVCSRAVERVLRLGRPPLWLILILGAILQTILGGIYIGVHQRFFLPFLPAPGAFKPFDIGPGSVLSNLPRMLMQNAGPIMIWIGVNYFFDRLVGFPRFRYEHVSTAPVATEPAATEPAANRPPTAPPALQTVAALASGATGRLHSRLPDNIKGEILAISALDHYLQVLTDKGSAVVHGRLTDAISEMPPGEGWQVHRSHWVRRSAVRRLLIEQQKYSLERVDGTIIPVSTRYVEVLKLAGLKPEAIVTRRQ